MNKKAVIFDMDGVIIDNYEYHKKAWMAFSNKYGQHFTEDELKNIAYGRTNDEILPLVFKKSLPEDQIINMSDEKEALYREMYKGSVVLNTGLEQLLKELRKTEMPIGVATSAPTENVDFIFNETGIRYFFDVVVDASEVSKGKPDPQIYLKAAHKLGVEPKDCVVFEDSFSGMEAARRAGMIVIGVATMHTKNEIKNTSLVIKDFTEISVDIINQIFSEI